jgi:hypothetical protein
MCCDHYPSSDNFIRDRLATFYQSRIKSAIVFFCTRILCGKHHSLFIDCFDPSTQTNVTIVAQKGKYNYLGLHLLSDSNINP